MDVKDQNSVRTEAQQQQTRQFIRISQIWEAELFCSCYCQGSSKNQGKHCHNIPKEFVPSILH